MTKVLNVQIEVDIEDIDEGECQAIRVVSVKLDGHEVKDSGAPGAHVWTLLTDPFKTYFISVAAGDL